MTRSLLLAAFGLILLVAPARAQEDARAAAQKKMAAGAQLLDQGQPAEALRLFREAHAAFPNQRWQYSIGIASQATGRDVEALEAFQIFLENSQGAPQINVDDARKQVEVLRARVAAVRITAREAGAGVLVDGRDVGRTPLPRPVLLEPGEHRFMVRKAEFEPFERVLNVKPGEQTVAAELRRIVKVVAPPPAVLVAPPPSAPPAETPLYQRWWLWTAVGAVVVTGVVIAVASSSGSKNPDCRGGLQCVR
jgi:tetratricopeptide (TPR) repeat protein